MLFFKRPFMAVVILAFVLAAVGGIAGVLYFGVFNPHSQDALDTFNGVYGTAATRLDTCKTCHTTGRSTNTYGTHLKSEFSRMMTPRGGESERESSSGHRRRWHERRGPGDGHQIGRSGR